LPQDAPSYVERQADRDLFDGLLKGEFCYVLTSRQMGKSSLMVRTSNRLRIKGINVVSLDLTAIGQNLTPEQWYDGLLVRMGRQLHLEEELDGFWKQNERVSPVQRLMSVIRDVVMVKRPGPLVIFVDEIDTVRSLPFSTDEFFSAIRECYNRRTEDPDLNRLTFCLLGVATPSDLIRDTRTTPFNIGRRIELYDFTRGEAAPLANGLGRETKNANHLLERILFWTNGHPYLTQRLCQAIAEDKGVGNASGVDRHCQELFLSNRARERDDNLLFVRERLLRSEVDLASLLSLYERVWNRKRVRDDETNSFISFLRLTGIIRVVHGLLEVRNRIYHRVFDQTWVRANMPDQELRRQREAFRRGLLRGAGVVAILTVVSLGVAWFITKQVKAREARAAIENFGKVYTGFTTYQDIAEIKQDFEMEGGTKVSTSGTLTLALEKPNKLNLSVKISRGISDVDIQVVSDGERLWTYRRDIRQYTVGPAPDSLKVILDQADGIAEMDFSYSAYGLILSKDPQVALAKQSKTLRFLGKEPFDGDQTHVLTWTEQAPERSAPGPASKLKPLPLTAWIGSADGLIRQWKADLSELNMTAAMPSTFGPPRMVKLRNFVTTMKHSNIKLNASPDETAFTFKPPAEARQVQRFQSRGDRPGGRESRSSDSEPQFDKTRLPELIPARAPNTPPQLIDLSAHYNAPLTEPWHSQRTGNDLSALPRGLQTIAGTPFDIRGVVQLAGRGEFYMTRLYPRQVREIAIGLKCRRLHFLHGAAWTTQEGMPIGSYIIHHADGQRRSRSIIYGFDVRDWWADTDATGASTGILLAWSGSNPASQPQGQKIALYKSTWENPLPDIEVKAIDYVSSIAEPAPFLIGITAE